MNIRKLARRKPATRIAVPEEVKSKVIRVRVTEQEFKTIYSAAKQRGVTVSMLLIETVLKKIKRELKNGCA
ncbi:MAG: hypothetical protein PHF86_04850 [Candidatus Nanoarchaeia archaeon]|jgi:uncharacterized protein (DUF1778 family)|nr:hypothetical protein [Candidatus Nanoarchaeia archaeon]